MPTKINWLEIPAVGFRRALRFYEAVFDTELKAGDFDSLTTGIFTDAGGNDKEPRCCTSTPYLAAPGKPAADRRRLRYSCLFAPQTRRPDHAATRKGNAQAE